MSASQSSRASWNPTMVPGAPSLPQVNLLPPEIQAMRQFGKIRAWLGIALLGTILLAGLAYVSAVYSATRAQNELVDTQAQNQQLLKDQGKYAEVGQVLAHLSESTNARKLGMSTEVMWKKYFEALAATAPAGVNIETLAVLAATPSTAAAITANPLQEPSVGTLTFGARSLVLPDTAGWLDGLASINGFADPWISSTQITETDGKIYYQVSGSVQLTQSAYELRFVADPGVK